MTWTWSQIITQMSTYHEYARNDWYDAEYDVNKAWDKYYAGDDHLAIRYLVHAGKHFLDVAFYTNFWYIYNVGEFDSMSEALFKLADARIKAIKPEITMRGILDVMFTASNEELKQFVGLVDAYRQSLWNKPFDRELWASYARGFEQWE